MTKPRPCDPDAEFLKDLGQIRPDEPKPGLCQVCRKRPTDPSSRIPFCAVCIEEHAEMGHYRRIARSIVERISECPYPGDDEMEWLVTETTHDLIDLPLSVAKLRGEREATQEDKK